VYSYHRLKPCLYLKSLTLDAATRCDVEVCAMKAVLLGIGMCAALQLGAVTIGQVDTFETSSEGWVIGAGPVLNSPTPVPTVATGGPGGAGDAYLSIVSTGQQGPGPRLTAQNFGQWAGNYVAAGVGAIAMDVRNFGETDLALRLLFVDLGAQGPVNVAGSATAIPVAAGSGWQRIVFPVYAGALTAGLGTITSALTGADELRIFHSVTGEFPPAAIAASLGVDNIAAVPEPATWMMLGSALAMLAAGRSAMRRN
jgi:hypothetical protein